jgi:uncharacterized protein (DUF1697 family)
LRPSVPVEGIDRDKKRQPSASAKMKGVGTVAGHRFVALLRAVNIGSTQVSMAELRALFVALGAGDVQTYVQSGNVVFTSDVRDASRLSRTIAQRIRRDLSLDVTVLVRTRAELTKVVAGNPFVKHGVDPKTLHVTFLADKPERERIRGIGDARSGEDEFEIVGREVFVHCPHGYGRTKINNTFFEKKLGVAATTRNWKTVQTLLQLASAS